MFAGRDAQLLTVGEMPTVTLEEARRFTDPANAEIDMVFQFEHVMLDQGATKWEHRPLALTDLKASLARWQEGLADVGWNSLYWNNHDQPRAVSRFGDDGAHRVAAAKMLGTVLHLHRGTPFVYQGEELGMTNSTWAGVEDFRDIESLNHYAEAVGDGAEPEAVLADLRRVGRDNARTPMQWDASEHAGFTSGTPWLAVNPNHREINAEAARADPDSVFHHYRRLIALRHDEPAVAHGDFAMLLPDDERVYAYLRRHDGVELLVARQLLLRAGRTGRPGGVGGRRGRGRRGAARRRARARALGGSRLPPRRGSVGEALGDDLAPRDPGAAQGRARRLGHRRRAADVDVAQGDVGHEAHEVLGREQRALAVVADDVVQLRRRGAGPARRARRAGSRPRAAARGRRRRCRPPRPACPPAAPGSA